MITEVDLAEYLKKIKGSPELMQMAADFETFKADYTKARATLMMNLVNPRRLTRFERFRAKFWGFFRMLIHDEYLG